MRAIPAIYFDFIKREEELRVMPYDDAQPNHALAPGDKVIGTLTGGWGHTGPGVQDYIGHTIPDDIIDKWLEQDAKMAAWKLGLVIGQPTVDALTDHQYAALLSFVFNVGAKQSYPIWALVRARKWDAVADDMQKYDRARGRVLVGLDNRRHAEVKLFNTPDVIPVEHNPSSAA